MLLTPLYDGKRLDSEKRFQPTVLTMGDFADIKVSVAVKETAVLASQVFKKRFDEGCLFPPLSCETAEIDEAEDPLIHDYTGQCPAQTFEVNPVKGCNVGCAYCLVDDGMHAPSVVYQNYHELVEKWLTEYRNEKHFYYFSPKTEALCEATLQTGIAHNILRTFAEHFIKYPDSGARLFIASKAGIQALNYAYDGESILDLFIKLKGKMQFNASLSILPENAIAEIEPYSSSLQDRLAAVGLCRENGIAADSVLVQPILISSLTDEILAEFFAKLKFYGIINFKPEFLTASVENMTLMAQILSRYDNGILKKIFEAYFHDDNLNHKKQRDRTAPPRQESLFWINKMREIARRQGISISICNWVKGQLNISEDYIPSVNENGYKCLGYQTKLFESGCGYA
jgi:DNA repair photolyase